MKPPKHFFSGGEGRGVAYDTPQECAAFLFENPDLVNAFNESQIGLAFSFIPWRDFTTMREILNMTVDVHIELAKMRVKNVE